MITYQATRFWWNTVLIDYPQGTPPELLTDLETGLRASTVNHGLIALCVADEHEEEMDALIATGFQVFKVERESDVDPRDASIGKALQATTMLANSSAQEGI